MENKEIKTWHLLVFTALCALMIYMIYYKEQTTQQKLVTVCKEDSLLNVIEDLKMELKFQEEGFSGKEQRYEDILFEYEFGVERLKETHPSAYKEFHRIIAFKEKYSVQDKIENQKRLKLNE